MGLQKGSLYHYIKGKEELLLWILDHWVDNAFQPLKVIVESSDSPRDKLSQAVRNHIDQCIAEIDQGSVFLREHKALPQEYLSKHVARRDAYEGLFLRIVTEGIESGDFPSVDAKMVTLVILGACNWLVQWYSASGRLSAREVADQFVELLVDCMLARQQMGM